MPKGYPVIPHEKRRAEIPIGPSIAYIPLTHGLFAMIDRDDAALSGLQNWSAKYDSDIDGHYVCGVTRLPSGKRSEVRLHRVLMGIKPGDERHIDHINHNPLDNRRCNLRVATPSQNSRNRRRRSDNHSGFKGVWRVTNSTTYRAMIKTDGKRIHLGCRPTAEAAYRELYVPASLRYHREFSRP